MEDWQICVKCLRVLFFLPRPIAQLCLESIYVHLPRRPAVGYMACVGFMLRRLHYAIISAELLTSLPRTLALLAMKETLRLALMPSVIKRALKYAFVVGLILITINHSDAILRGQVSAARFFRMALTVMVPYIVSTLSSVGALRDRNSSSSAKTLEQQHM